MNNGELARENAFLESTPNTLQSLELFFQAAAVFQNMAGCKQLAHRLQSRRSKKRGGRDTLEKAHPLWKTMDGSPNQVDSQATERRAGGDVGLAHDRPRKPSNCSSLGKAIRQGGRELFLDVH